MIPVLTPTQLGQEIWSCVLWGAGIGAVRAFLPGKGRAAFVPDLVLVGAVLGVMQSYAASQSFAGVLRWYMVAAGFAGAAAAEALLGIPVRFCGRMLAAPLRILVRRRAVRRKRRKERRNAKTTAKNQKKSLPKQRRMLYNSNVSK